MKIIHCADIHLDSPMNIHLSKEKAQKRRKELLINFCNMIEYANISQIHTIIIAGDLFDQEYVSMNTQNIVVDTIKQNSDIIFYYLKGNHDKNNYLEQESSKLLNLRLFDDDWRYYELEEDVVIAGIENIQQDMYQELNLKENKKNIVILHGQVGKNENDNELISIEKMKNKNIDYLALGHYHTFQTGNIDNRGVWAYSGCLEGRGYDEIGEKGFVLIDTDQINPQFYPFAKRKIEKIKVDISNASSLLEVQEYIKESINRIDNSSFLRLKLTGNISMEFEKELNISYLELKFQERFYHLQIRNETKIKINMDDYLMEPSLKSEFIKAVWESELTDKEKTQVLQLGVQALLGEEIDY